MKNTLITICHNNSNYTISLRSRESGHDIIFFIHGLGCAQNNFDDAWNAEGLANYSIVTIDLPGFGGSAMNDGFSCDMKEYAEICCNVLSLFPRNKIHIVGHSMGGAIGVLLADMIRDRLASFVNVEGNLVSQDCTTSRRKASVSYEEFISKQLPGLILTTSLSDEPGRKMWSHTMRNSDKKSLYLSSRSLVAWSDSGQLLKIFKELDCPRVYLYGEKNSFLHVLSFLGAVQTVAISQSGHFPMIDNPEGFYRFLSNFLKGIISAGT
jgi:pimeloyl-ACP methyl ester carboxylesterase